jgi:hypothetical protein
MREPAPDRLTGQPAQLQKVTLYIRPEQVFKLEEIQLQERRRTGVRPKKSELVQEALDLLIQRYTSRVAGGQKPSE